MSTNTYHSQELHLHSYLTRMSTPKHVNNCYRIEDGYQNRCVRMVTAARDAMLCARVRVTRFRCPPLTHNLGGHSLVSASLPSSEKRSKQTSLVTDIGTAVNGDMTRSRHKRRQTFLRRTTENDRKRFHSTRLHAAVHAMQSVRRKEMGNHRWPRVHPDCWLGAEWLRRTTPCWLVSGRCMCVCVCLCVVCVCLSVHVSGHLTGVELDLAEPLDHVVLARSHEEELRPVVQPQPQHVLPLRVERRDLAGGATQRQRRRTRHALAVRWKHSRLIGRLSWLAGCSIEPHLIRWLPVSYWTPFNWLAEPVSYQTTPSHWLAAYLFWNHTCSLASCPSLIELHLLIGSLSRLLLNHSPLIGLLSCFLLSSPCGDNYLA